MTDVIPNNSVSYVMINSQLTSLYRFLGKDAFEDIAISSTNVGNGGPFLMHRSKKNAITCYYCQMLVIIIHKDCRVCVMSVLCKLLLPCTFTCAVFLCSIYHAVMVGVMCGSGRLRKCFCSALTPSLSEPSDTHIHTHTHTQSTLRDRLWLPARCVRGRTPKQTLHPLPLFHFSSPSFTPILHFPNFISNLSTRFFFFIFNSPTESLILVISHNNFLSTPSAGRAPAPPWPSYNALAAESLLLWIMWRHAEPRTNNAFHTFPYPVIIFYCIPIIENPLNWKIT